MAMPKQVEQEIKALEELEKQMQAPAEEVGETVEADVQPEAGPTAPVEAAPTPQAVEPVVSEETWEHKYTTLIGKYNAEVPRLHSQVKELMGQVDYLDQQLQNRPTEASKPTQETRSLITDEEIDLYGADLIDLQRRVAEEVASKYDAMLNAAQTKIDSLEQRLMQTGNQVGEMSFEQTLVRKIPDWEKVNADPRWVKWLDETDPVLRAPRRVVAQQAYNASDVDGVAHYVALFQQANPSQTKPSPRKTELERQVAPSRNSTTGTVAQPTGRTYSYADWMAASANVDVLVARGKYDEATKLEAELADAMQHGRVLA